MCPQRLSSRLHVLLFVLIFGWLGAAFLWSQRTDLISAIKVKKRFSDFVKPTNGSQKNSGRHWTLMNDSKSKRRRDLDRLMRRAFGVINDDSVYMDDIPASKVRDGPGELGRPVFLKSSLTPEVQRLIKEGWANNAFDQYISDTISLRRSLPDVRLPECKAKEATFSKSLPSTSVIIIFNNEAWSTLVRTVYSVLDRSPTDLIKEIILVDDFSDMAHLGKRLDEYMSKLSDKVKIVRAEKREGLIRAKLLGTKHASGEVLTFLDSHCEATEGWLEPLLDRIAQSPTAVVCPVIDLISDKTFEFTLMSGNAKHPWVGGFGWEMQFNWQYIPERELKRRSDVTEPIRSATMAGGLFAIRKDYFEHLGTYDRDFDIWGGENLELSFKTWMCGGTLEICPCSHVGHISRGRDGYKFREITAVHRRNSIRLAEVWMDDYKRYFYDFYHLNVSALAFGDVTTRIELRKSLECKTFDWYLKTVFPELKIPPETLASGELRNFGGPSCLDAADFDSNSKNLVGLYTCHNLGGNQYWTLTTKEEVRRNDACLDFTGEVLVLFPCHGSKGNQQWHHDAQSGLVRHHALGVCLEASTTLDKLWTRPCNQSILNQRWRFSFYRNKSVGSEHLENRTSMAVGG